MTQSFKVAKLNSQIIAIICAVIVFAMMPAGAAIGASSTSKDLSDSDKILQSSIDAIRLRPSVDFICDMMMTMTVNGASIVIHSKSRTRMDGDRIDLTTDQYDSEGGQEVLAVHSRAIWDGHYYILRESHPALMADVTHYASGTQRKLRKNITFKMDGGMHLDGCIPGGTELACEALLAHTSPLEFHHENIDGYDCDVISGESPSGIFGIWIDPANGFMARRMTYHQRRGDTLEDGERYSGDSGDGELSKVTVQLIGDHYIVTGGTITTKVINNGIVYSESSGQFVRSAVVWNPDFDQTGAFKMDEIPEGVNVTNWDPSGIRLVWQKGSPLYDSTADIVQRIDHEVANMPINPSGGLISGGEEGSGWTVTTWLVAIALCLVACIGWYLLRFRNDPKQQ